MLIDCLKVATEIHGWLAGLQISQKWIPANFEKDSVAFTFEHPERGEIAVAEKLTSDPIFSTNGVAFEIDDRECQNGKVRVYDYGGIYDPFDGRVMGEHYSTSHFALLSAILHEQSREPTHLEQAKRAFEFHMHTSRDEYAFSEWMYHWDFQNYALIECFARLSSNLEDETKTEWSRCLRNWRTNSKNKLSNWAAMRALAYLQRGKLWRSAFDKWMSRWNYRVALYGEQPDGCIDDEKNVSRPIQYHIYTTALLHRMYLLNGQDKIARKFLNGIEFFMPFVDPDGDFNYWGRGHGQIFGHGAAIYALLAAANLTGDGKYRDCAAKLFDYLNMFKKDDHFPLVLNSHDDREQMGWYDYHHTTVYNAFLGVWLALASEVQSHEARTAQIATKPQVQSQRNFAFLTNEHYFIAVGQGLPHYSSEAGLSPCHLWSKELGWIFSSPGGPTEDTFGKFYGDKEIRKNFLAPIIISAEGRLISPAGNLSGFTASSTEEITCFADYGLCKIDRIIRIRRQSLEISDTITFKQDFVCKEFRLLNLPLIEDKFEYSFGGTELVIKSVEGSMVLSCDITGAGAEFEALETIRTVKGLAKVIVKRLTDLHVKKNEQFTVRLTFQAVPSVMSSPVAAEYSEQLSV